MDARVKAIDPLRFPGWDEWVQTFNGHNIFHSRSWARVLARSYGYQPHYLVLYRNGAPQAAWPMLQTQSAWAGRKGVSLPFSDHCAPLVSDEKDFNDLFDEIVSHARRHKWKSIEFRAGERFFKPFPVVANYNLHQLTLSPDEKEMLSRFRSSNRRNIKKAIKAQIDITIEASLEALREFYSLNCLTRQHHGLPPQPFKFFKNIYRYIIKKKMGIVVLARHQDRPIAGAVYFHFGETATYKYGASHRKYLAQRPNNLVMWEAIKWYASLGYKYFDFGRSEPDNKGLNQFKNSWGTTASTIAYYRYDPVRQTFLEKEDALPPFIHHVFRRMPVPVLRILGSMAYRHMA
jgi:hypothetical protein